MAKTGCDKNCSTCDLNNRAFCAVQLGFKNQELILQLGAALQEQQKITSSLIQVLSPLLGKNEAPIPPIPGGADNVPEAETKTK